MNKPQQQLARTLTNSVRTHVIFERDFYVTLGAAFGTGLLISIALMILVLLLSDSTYAADAAAPRGVCDGSPLMNTDTIAPTPDTDITTAGNRHGI